MYDTALELQRSLIFPVSRKSGAPAHQAGLQSPGRSLFLTNPLKHSSQITPTTETQCCRCFLFQGRTSAGTWQTALGITLWGIRDQSESQGGIPGRAGSQSWDSLHSQRRVSDFKTENANCDFYPIHQEFSSFSRQICIPPRTRAAEP